MLNKQDINRELYKHGNRRPASVECSTDEMGRVKDGPSLGQRSTELFGRREAEEANRAK